MLVKSFVLLGAIALSACAPVLQRTPPEKTIQFLLVNDVYLGEPMSNGLGGVARLATLRQQLEKNAPLRMMLAGDFLFPSLVSKWYKGVQMIEYMNSAGIDYATYGNHEFDDSRQTLVNRIAESKFKWTSANCMNPDGTPLPGVSLWDTVTIAGTRIGIVGVTVIQTYPRWIKCGNPDSAMHATIPKLKAAGAEIVIGLTHVYHTEDSTYLANEPALDFILGGHDHVAQHITIGNRFVVKADKNVQSAQLVTLVKRRGQWSKSHRLIKIDSTIPGNSLTAAVVSRWQDSLEKRLGPVQVLANSPVVLDAVDEALRKRETEFGNFVADAIRAGTGADVTATIGGAMRYDDEIPAGPVTNREIESIYLFPDETRVVTFPISGMRLRALLERGISRGGATWGGYLQVSGVQFEWDSTRAAGSRIVGEVRRPDGREISPTEMIRFSINAYTACDSGDGYSIPESADACTRRESGPRAAQLVMDYMRAQKTIKLPAVSRVRRIR